MTDIILSGCSGQMGRVVKEICEKDSEVRIVAGVDKYNPGNESYNIFPSFDLVNVNADVIIDFSNPDMLEKMLDFALSKKIPVVIATTGYDDEQIKKIKEAAKLIPVFFTFNMSVGVNLLRALAKTATKVLGNDFDIEIVEKHHNLKVDAPSGTAIMLANAVSEELKEKPKYEYDRHSRREKRHKNEIGIHSVRGGTIVGEHQIIFAGTDEVVTLTHEAHSKKVFAYGAVNAAKFLTTQPAGLYEMNDLIG